MFNSVTLVGYLGRDPEVRHAANGTAVAKLSLATTERFTDRNGSRREETQWHTVTAWGRQAELAQKFLHKGSRLLVEGKLTYRDWEDKEGRKKHSTEIVVRKLAFLDGRKNGDGEGSTFDDQGDIPF